MGAFFASASSQKLINSATPITAMPLSVGFWVYPTTTGTLRSFWSLCDTAGATNYLTLAQSSANSWRLATTDDATPLGAGIGTVTANQWAYVVGRFISATNKRYSVLQYDGSIVQGQITTSDTPIGLDTMALGCLNHSTPTNFFDGLLAEFWWANIDVQADGGVIQEHILRKLAYEGPYAFSHIQNNLVEYHSFRGHLGSDTFENDSDDFAVIPLLESLVNTNGVTIGPHPPLLYQERRLPHILRPKHVEKLWPTTTGGVDTSESRSGTSTGTATATGRIEVRVETRAAVTATASVDADIAVQDAKRSTVTGTATVTGVSDYRNATWEQPGTSTGQATVVGRSAVQDAKRSTVEGSATVTGTLTQSATLSRSGTSSGEATVVGRISVEDRKRSTVIAGATVVGGVAGTDTSESRSGTSSAQAAVEARIAWQAEIMGQSDGSSTVNGVSTSEDLSGGGAVIQARDAPFIVNMGTLMNR